MTVKELVIQLLNCNMNKEIVLYDNLEYEDEIFGKTRGVTFPIENVVKSGIVLIEFDNSKKINKVLDGIRAEIENIAFDWQEIDGEHESRMVVDLNDALEIINKYKAESEPQESEDKE